MKLLLPITAVLLLSACVNDPNSPFYTGTSTNTSITSVVENVATAVPDVEDVTEIVEASTEAVSEEASTSTSQCLTSDVLANVTYSVIPKGAKGIVEKSGGNEYFVTGGKRHDVTNVPYSLTSC